MQKEATAMSVRQNLGAIINEIQYLKTSFVITRGSKPVAAIIDIDEYNRMQNAKKQFKKLTLDLQKKFKNVDRKKIEKDINEAVKFVRHQNKTKKNENNT